MADFIKDWTDKEVDRLTASFKRYRAFVFCLKCILPISAAVLLVMIILFAENDDNSAKITVENVAEPSIKPDQISSVGKMSNPRFQGLDAENQPYSLMAEQAWQQGTDVIEMENINADITTKDGKWMSAVAGAATYQMNENIANLREDVGVFISGKGDEIIQIQTQNLHLDIRKATAESDSEISVISGLSNFSASGFTLDRNAQKISFKGPIKLVIIP